MADFETPLGAVLGYQQITIDGTSGGVGFTTSKFKVDPTGAGTGERFITARVALLTLEGTAGTNDIRWTVDGTAPTSTEGHLMLPGKSLLLRGAGAIEKFRAIRTTTTSGTLSCTFFVD